MRQALILIAFSVLRRCGSLLFLRDFSHSIETPCFEGKPIAIARLATSINSTMIATSCYPLISSWQRAELPESLNISSYCYPLPCAASFARGVASIVPCCACP